LFNLFQISIGKKLHKIIVYLFLLFFWVEKLNTQRGEQKEREWCVRENLHICLHINYKQEKIDITTNYHLFIFGFCLFETRLDETQTNKREIIIYRRINYKAFFFNFVNVRLSFNFLAS
jgi:hypothetical protein